jgi:DNA replication protein DnaC
MTLMRASQVPLITVGVGKSHLACSLGHIAIRRRKTVLMARADKLFKRLKAARLDNSLDAEMRKLTGIQLLIIDDLALQRLDATETTDFYQLCVERHQKAATVITSNRTPEEWLSMMADPLLAQSAVDRLASTAHELIIEGQSCRQRQKPSITIADQHDVPSPVSRPCLTDSGPLAAVSH